MNKITQIVVLVSLFVASSMVSAESLHADPATITEIFVNGGADSPNAGTTCFKISLPDMKEISENCTSGYIGIANNNRQLLSALLEIKSTNSEAWVYYNDDQPHLHCPGLAFTPGVLNSISIK
jgi:hypothetical protein